MKDKKDHYRVVEENYTTKCTDFSGIKRNEKGMFTKDSKIKCKKRSIRILIEEHGLFGFKSIEKVIPKAIMQLSKDKLAIFLNRLFSCDGSIYKPHNNWESCYASSSEKLIRQVQHLLLRFGIVSKLRNKIIDKIIDCNINV